MKTLKELRALYKTACEAVQRAAQAIDDAAEDADFDALRTTLDDATEAAERAKKDVEDRERLEQARSRFAVVGGDEPEAREPIVEVGAPEDVYRPDNRTSFFGDLYSRDFLGNQEARERLTRHYAQTIESIERRDVGTGAFAGLVVPQYLVDQFAPLTREGRAFADYCFGQPLPADGMVLSISRATTGTSAAIQASENAAVSETDFDDTKLDVNVRTIAGQQDVSRQALERGTMIDAILFADLIAAYNAALDAQILTGAGTSGTHLGLLSTSGINAVTYTDASPTVAELWPKLADAIQQVASNRKMGADAIWMHPRRWGWLTAAVDSNGRPLVPPVANGPSNAGGVNSDVTYGAAVGTLQGLPVYTDANIPTNLGAGTNEDIIVVTRKMDNILWEDGDGTPRQARFEQTAGGNLTVKLVLYGYSAFTSGRYPTAHSTIGGTGLVTPTF